MQSIREAVQQVIIAVSIRSDISNNMFNFSIINTIIDFWY